MNWLGALLWTVWEQGIHPPERLLYLKEVELKKLRLISQRGSKGETSPLETLTLKEVEKEKVFENEIIFSEKVYKYEPTNMGNAYDSRYWSWVRMIGCYRENEEEEKMAEKIKQAKELIKS